MTTIRPVAPSPTSSQEINDNDAHDDVVYEFACRRALPRVDCRKSIKHAMLSPRWLTRVNRLLHSSKLWVSLSYAVGLVCGSLVLFVPSVTVAPSANRWLGIITFVLGLPSHTTAFLALRFDMVVLVCRTFEFWYITLLNAATMALLCMTMHDARTLAVFSASLAFQVAFCIDAIFRSPRIAIAVTAFGAITNVIFIVYMGFQFLPNVHRFVLVTLRHGEITSDDIVTNALATVAVLLMRNAFRKFQSLQTPASVGPSTRTAVGTCITYRCCLELRPKQTSDRDHARPLSQTAAIVPHMPSQRADTIGSFTQLQYVGSSKSFSARSLIAPRSLVKLSLAPWSRCTHVALWLLGAVGLVALIAFHVLERLMGEAWRGGRAAVSLVAFLSTGGFCGVYFAHCQRELLLRELGRSFDYLFVATQSFCAHLCVCDLYAWDVRCLNVAANWFLSQWILNLDAVTPIMKRKLGFHKAGAAIVGLVMLFQQLLLIVTTFQHDGFSSGLQQRVLFSIRLGERTLDVSVVSVLLGRILVTWLWSVRIGWRLFDRQEAELLVLQGQLQYDEGVRARTRIPTKASAATDPPTGLAGHTVVPT